MQIIEHFSPNCNERAANNQIDTLILHYTGMKSGKEALERMCDPKAQVSAHYMVEEDGSVYYLVPETKRAWHAGISHWRGRGNLNNISIGIEIVNPGHEWGYHPFPEAQMQSVETLCADIIQRQPIDKRNVIGHSDIAPSRKQDPGELFDWKRLADKGIGLWPGVVSSVNNRVIYTPGSRGNDVLELQQRLKEFGYWVEETGVYDEQMQYVVTAFKRHYCPQHLDAKWDNVAEKTLAEMLVLSA